MQHFLKTIQSVFEIAPKKRFEVFELFLSFMLYNLVSLLLVLLLLLLKVQIFMQSGFM